MANKSCDHLENLTLIKPEKTVCEECIKTGDQWVHLRNCQTCGTVLCCDASTNQHATKHFHASGHPVVVSVSSPPWTKFAWCYEHKIKRDLPAGI